MFNYRPLTLFCAFFVLTALNSHAANLHNGLISHFSEPAEEIRMAYNDQNFDLVIQLVQEKRDADQEISPTSLFYEGRALQQLNQVNGAIERLEEFLDSAPASHQYIREGVGEINSLLLRRAEEAVGMSREDELYEIAVETESPRHIDIYLRNFPDGTYADELKILLDNVNFQEAAETDTRPAYRTYLNNFPDGVNRDEANRRIDALNAADQISRVETRIAAVDENISYLERRRSRATFSGLFYLGALGGGGTGLFLYSQTLPDDNEDKETYMAIGVAAIAAGVLLAYTSYGTIRTMNRGLSEQRDRRRGYERELHDIRSSIAWQVSPDYDFRHNAPGIRLTVRF